MSLLVPPDSFEYLCYGSKAIRNMFTLYNAVIDCRSQILTTKVDPRAVRVKNFHFYATSFQIFNIPYFWFE